MRRPDDREFMKEVLRDLKDIPEGLATCLADVVGQKQPERAEAIRKVFEEFARD